MKERFLLSLEYDKVLNILSGFAALKGTKRQILSYVPSGKREDAELLLRKTGEAYKLLFTYGVGGVEYYDEPGDELERASKGSSLTLAELLRVARLLKSARIIKNAFTSVNDEEITLLPAIANCIYCDQYIEQEIFEKILSEDKVADNASVKLSEIRKNIKRLNEQIRSALSNIIKDSSKYLQDNIVTMRGDRYVVPVKNEYRSRVKGFVHDQSATGSTVFIEPVEVLELNNRLRSATIEEQLEIEEIIRDLSHKVGLIADRLYYDGELCEELDEFCARAEYAQKIKGVKPIVNDKGIIDIRMGRHPLIDAKKVVPVTLKFGDDCNYLLITGPNTGGKTVTLKMVGLFSLMAMSGMYLPAAPDTRVSVFDEVFCDVGDEQSIEQNLSTFSSHIKNIVEITSEANSKSLVLIDEIGAGTDPDEGAALAQAVLEKLLDERSYGIITTHYSRLKEYAYTDKRIKNASMEFDPVTFAPLYRINVGAPGSSNALEIAKRLGLDEDICKNAVELLSDDKVSFEQVLREAEKTRQKAKEELDELEKIKAETVEERDKVVAEREKLSLERQRLFEKAKAESRRVVSEKLLEAEELVDKIKEILEKDEISSGDIITARTLKNKLEEKKYNLEEKETFETTDNRLTIDDAKPGVKVYIPSMNAIGDITTLPNKKGEVQVAVGAMRLDVKVKELFFAAKSKSKEKAKKQTVQVTRDINTDFKKEINVVGKRREEALDEVTRFIDSAVLSGASEVKIIHGVGQNILRNSVKELLKGDKRIKSIRPGDYSEGGIGVTVAELK